MDKQEFKSHFMPLPRCRIARFALVALIFSSASSFAVDEPPTADNHVSVGAETYTEPRPKSHPMLEFPSYELWKGEEGWVYVQMMIDPEGKPYELEVIDTTGSKTFEKLALKTTESMRFAPATLGGKPIDSLAILPFFFSIDGPAQAVSVEYKKNYEVYEKALKAKDKDAAETALSKLHAKNLTENAYLGLAKYSFAQHWGTDKDQLSALRQAVSGMTTPKYLPKDVFIVALRGLFLAEIKDQDYGSAMSTWAALKILDGDAQVLKKLEPIVANVEALRTDPRPYAVPGTLRDGVWSYRLFRNKFHINVLAGHVSQIKLYCEKKYVLFPFDSTLEYKVEDKFGKCSMVVVGDGGTSIELVQKT